MEMFSTGERALNFESRSNASNDLDGQLVNKVAQFFSTRSLQLKIPQNTISDLKRSIEEGKAIRAIIIFQSKWKKDNVVHLFK
jgi:hypothetical protein